VFSNLSKWWAISPSMSSLHELLSAIVLLYMLIKHEIRVVGGGGGGLCNTPFCSWAISCRFSGKFRITIEYLDSYEFNKSEHHGIIDKLSISFQQIVLQNLILALATVLGWLMKDIFHQQKIQCVQHNSSFLCTWELVLLWHTSYLWH
jgi:hypothetical protein